MHSKEVGWKDSLTLVGKGLLLNKADEIVKKELISLKRFIGVIRIGARVGVILLIIGILLVVFRGILFLGTTELTHTPTFTITPTITVSPTDEPTITATLATSTIAPTATLAVTSTPTPVPIMGYAKLKRNFFPLDEPNGARVQQVIDGKNLGDFLIYDNQIVTVVDIEFAPGGIWYKCVWDVDGYIGEGWILEGYIEYSPPTPILPPTS